MLHFGCLIRFWPIWFWQVSDEGDVLYVFPKDYRSNLMAKSFRMKIEPLLEKAKVLILFLLVMSMCNLK